VASSSHDTNTTTLGVFLTPPAVCSAATARQVCSSPAGLSSHAAALVCPPPPPPPRHPPSAAPRQSFSRCWSVTASVRPKRVPGEHTPTRRVRRGSTRGRHSHASKPRRADAPRGQHGTHTGGGWGVGKGAHRRPPLFPRLCVLLLRQLVIQAAGHLLVQAGGRRQLTPGLLGRPGGRGAGGSYRVGAAGQSNWASERA
jgi:hypothetical protein